MTFTRRTEVRHILQPHLIRMAEILGQPSTNPAWKKLMQIVPLELTDHEKLNDSRPKYNIQHIKSIETAGIRQNNAAQLFLEEWSTSGRIRPTLSHLLQLLVQSELFRAADYVAINLLSEAPPQRPQQGPAARIDISLPDDDNDIDDGLLNGNYPNTSEIMDLNRCHGAAGKTIANKQIFDRSLLPDRTTSDQASTVPPLSENVTATPVQTVEGLPPRPVRRGRNPVSQVNGSPPPQNTNKLLSANKSVAPSRTMNESSAGIVNGQREAFAGNVPHFSKFTNPSQSGNEFPGMKSTAEEEANCPTVKPVEQHLSTKPVPAAHNFVPNFFSFSDRSSDSIETPTQRSDANVPCLSTLNIANSNRNDLNATEQGSSSIGNLPCLSQLLQPSESTLNNRATEQNSNERQGGNVLHSSQLMGERQSNFDNSVSEVTIDEPMQTNSNESVNGNVPHLSQLLSIPQPTSNISTSGRSGCNSNESFDGNFPHFSQLMDQPQPTSANSVSELNANNEQDSFGGNVPHLSQLIGRPQPTSNSSTSGRSGLNSNESFDGNFPHFSQLMDQPQAISANSASELNANNEQNSFDGNVPHFSQIIGRPQPTSNSSASGLNSNESFDGNLPHFSQLNANDERMQTNSNESIDGNIPHLSQIIGRSQPISESSATGLNSSESFDGNVPHLSQLMNGT